MAGSGYPVPANLPDETGCLIVFYPKDDGHFFSQALAGQLTQLNSYWVWDTDIVQAHDIGLLWAKHNLRTMLAWENLDCELAEIIEGDEDMNVNVTVNGSGGCGCGCGCGSGGGNQNQPFGINPLDPPVTGTPTTPSEEEVTEIDAWKCDAATQLWEDWYQFFQEVGVVGGAGIAGVTALAQIAVAFSILTGGIGFLLLLIAGLAVSISGGVTGLAKDWMELHREGLICAIVSAASPAQARANVLAYIEAYKNSPHGSFAGYWVGQVLTGITGDTDWNMIFTEDSFPIASGNVGSDCSACEPSPLTQLPDSPDWYLVPMSEGDVVTEVGTATFEVTDYVWRYYANTTGTLQEAISYLDAPGLLASGRTWRGSSQVVFTSEHAGFVLVNIDSTSNIRTTTAGGGGIFPISEADYPAGDTWDQWHTGSELSKADFQAGVASILAGNAIVHLSDRAPSNENHQQMTMDSTSDGEHETHFMLYAVIKATALEV